MKKLSELGVDHAYAPGAEPSFFQSLLAKLIDFGIAYQEVIWFLIFCVVVVVVFRVVLALWRLFGRLIGRPRTLEEEIEAERRRRLRLLARAKSAPNQPVGGAKA